MDFLTQFILPYIILYKYLALFIVTFSAALVVPIPAGTLLVASSAFASQGYFNLPLLLFWVIVANILGDNLSYFFARKYGKRLISHIPYIRKILVSKDFITIEKSINKSPGFIIVLSRFEVISTITLNIICGLSKVNYKKFLKNEIIGTFANVIFYSSIGYIFGNSWEIVNRLIGNFSIIFFVIVILGVSLFWRKIIRRLNKAV